MRKLITSRYIGIIASLLLIGVYGWLTLTDYFYPTPTPAVWVIVGGKLVLLSSAPFLADFFSKRAEKSIRE